MLDEPLQDVFQNPVYSQAESSFTDLGALFSEPAAFDTIDPSLTLTPPPSAPQSVLDVKNDFVPDLDYLGTRSRPGTPLPYQHNASIISDFPSPGSFGRRRSQSQPPEAVTFQRSSGHFIGKPSSLKHPYPQAQQAPGRSGDLKWRQHPYPRSGTNKARSRPRMTPRPTPLRLTALTHPPLPLPDPFQMPGVSPTSRHVAHSGNVNCTGALDDNALQHNGPGLWRPQSQYEPITALLGMSSRLDLFKREFEEIKELIRKGFAELGKHVAQQTETPQVSPRNTNYTLAHIEEPNGTTSDTNIVPTTEGEDPDLQSPRDGQELQGLDSMSDNDHVSGNLLTCEDSLDSLFEPLQ